MTDTIISKYMGDMNVQVPWAMENDYDSIPTNLMTAQVSSRNLKHMSFFSVSVEENTFTYDSIANRDEWNVVFSIGYNQNSEVAYYVEMVGVDAVMVIRFRQNKLNFTMAADSEQTASGVEAWVREAYPQPKIQRKSDSVPLAFWSQSPHGFIKRDKKIVPLVWEEIRGNYTAEARKQVDNLVAVHPPLDGGRLLLWHGPPGTGKSSAIRSLIHHWLPWCNASYVVDPEMFFGSAEYMLNVLLSSTNKQYDIYDEDYDEDEEEETRFILQGEERWNLLIIEDADEFLVADAKERTGQALSRLLNMSDGLIGQGLNFLCLITTNEPIANIHQAVSREGRCMANINFPALPRDEAEAWLGQKIPASVGGTEFPLAKLFDMRRELSQIKTEVKTYSTGVYL